MLKSGIKFITFTLLAFVLFGCESLFFHPSNTLLYNPDVCLKQPENYYILTEDGLLLHGWLFRSKAERVKATIIFMHGNGGNLANAAPAMFWVLNYGYNLFTFDYRGYGVSQGSPTITGVLSDGVDAIDAFMEIPEVDNQSIILFGQSLGGAVALAAYNNSKYSNRIKAVVIDSSFASFSQAAKDIAASSFLTWGFQHAAASFFKPFPSSLEMISKIDNASVVVIHSRADKMLPFNNGEKLFAAATEPKFFLISDNATHANTLNELALRKELVSIFDEIFP